ncbi:hypothetical protein TIFTF001_026853 [Ficus carica]|uniref:Uncharacterized protein n=1 Tax=Ficus carica TaxID=3494 RepID=A0AA88IXI8_FICCA|nr:hypothetical protein TIFTF001_026853 [Ficus carica]
MGMCSRASTQIQLCNSSPSFPNGCPFASNETSIRCRFVLTWWTLLIRVAFRLPSSSGLNLGDGVGENVPDSLGDGEERERERRAAWATARAKERERETGDLDDGEERERHGVGEGEEREIETGGLGDGEERERERRAAWVTARRERHTA